MTARVSIDPERCQGDLQCVLDVSVRAAGGVELSLVNSGKLHFAPQFGPDQAWVTDDTVVDDHGRAVFGINSLVARLGDAVVAIDPSSWPPDQTALGSATLEPGADLDDLLTAAGVRTEEVTHVVITHGHPDHFTGVVRGRGTDNGLRFPNAEHVFPAADWEVASAEACALLEPVARAGALRLVHGDHGLCDGVRLLHAPGESDGHQVVRIETDREHVYYLGDLVHLPVEFGQLDWVPVPGRDGATLRESRLRVFDEATRHPSWLVFTHGRAPAWGTIAQLGPDSWRWRYDDPG
jgi:glyoxylase-like metal-dependent hydrolase (beta-lactamase superfamily II)